MKNRSTTHQEAFSDLSMVEKTALDVLEDLHAEAESQDEKDAVSKVEEMILE